MIPREWLLFWGGLRGSPISPCLVGESGDNSKCIICPPSPPSPPSKINKSRDRTHRPSVFCHLEPLGDGCWALAQTRMRDVKVLHGRNNPKALPVRLGVMPARDTVEMWVVIMRSTARHTAWKRRFSASNSFNRLCLVFVNVDNQTNCHWGGVDQDGRMGDG